MSHWFNALETALTELLHHLTAWLFFPIFGLPAIVLWSIAGTVILSLRLRFVNLRCFAEAVTLLRVHNQSPQGVSSFQAFTTALSGTVGLGNIAGVAIAISVGGPGACLWMTVAGLLTMNTRLIECTLGRIYRETRSDGTVSGGPMYYLRHGLAAQGKHRWGKVLAAGFALCCVGASLGSSGMFQAGQSYRALAHVFPTLEPAHYGLALALGVGLVTWGGIHRIGQVTAWLVPVMCGLYVGAALVIVVSHGQAVPGAIALIWQDAWHPKAGLGGAMGMMVLGFQRAAFSNEGNIGTAAIAHAATEGTTPVQEGIISTLEPLVDTVVICNLTALVIILTGAYQAPQYAQFAGAELTSAAFGQAIAWFPWLLAIATFCFAFSTILAWGYYGQQAWGYLFGQRHRGIYHSLQLSLVFMGTVIRPELVVEISDLALLLMAVPNLCGLYSLTGEVRRELQAHFSPGTFSPDRIQLQQRSGQGSNL